MIDDEYSEEDAYTLTIEGALKAIEIDTYYRTTDMSMEEITVAVGLEDILETQMLYVIAQHVGPIDFYHEAAGIEDEEPEVPQE